jgi:hypothetical protein
MRRRVLLGLAVAALLGAALAVVTVWTRPVREAVAAYTELLGAVNRQDLEGVRRVCSSRYLATHRLVAASEGGVVGMPRNIHKNFQAWRQGANIWLCPTNRVGPVYQFVREQGAWRFDGPVGLLRGRNEFVPSAELVTPDVGFEDISFDDYPERSTEDPLRKPRPTTTAPEAKADGR